MIRIGWFQTVVGAGILLLVAVAVLAAWAFAVLPRTPTPTVGPVVVRPRPPA